MHLAVFRVVAVGMLAPLEGSLSARLLDGLRLAVSCSAKGAVDPPPRPRLAATPAAYAGAAALAALAGIGPGVRLAGTGHCLSVPAAAAAQAAAGVPGLAAPPRPPPGPLPNPVRVRRPPCIISVECSLCCIGHVWLFKGKAPNKFSGFCHASGHGSGAECSPELFSLHYSAVPVI